MRWREEDYDFVHGPILDDMRDQYENWKDAHDTTAQGAHQREICKQKMKQLENRAHKIRN